MTAPAPERRNTTGNGIDVPAPDIQALIEEANGNIERAAAAAPDLTAERIRKGEVEDQRLSLIVRMAAALSALSSHAETGGEWEYGTDYELTQDTSVQTPWHSREIAERYVIESPHETGLVRRREARDKAAEEYAPDVRSYARRHFLAGWDARGQAIKDDPRIPEVNKEWVLNPVEMKAATDEVRTGRRRARGQVTPDRGAIAKALRDYNDSAPSGPFNIEDDYLDQADAILALFNEKGNE